MMVFWGIQAGDLLRKNCYLVGSLSVDGSWLLLVVEMW